ncbi:MAG: putative hydrolase [Gammaproteobacteria bacterium]|nr:putative hydrolase [Gammaproteobacteria bacterium]
MAGVQSGYSADAARTDPYAQAEQEVYAAAAAQPSWMAQSSREFAAYWYGTGAGPDFTKLLSKTAVQIKARDGAQLHTEIYAPLNQTEPLPVILVRSPYGLQPDKFGYSAWLRQYTHLMRDGYIFAFQDTRGRGASTGQYVTAGPQRDPKTPHSTDESTDTYDTIDWLVKHVPNNNGRVGTLGISYGGFLVTRALVDPHPALKAASPQAPCVDMFIGDDFHHNGAFRLDYAFEWIGSMEEGIAQSSVLNRYDHFDRFLELGPLSNINKTILHGRAPSWNAFEEHPNYDNYWRLGICSVLPHIQYPVKVPTLTVGGWFDAEDHYGAVESYKKYEQGDKGAINNLVMGPWFHGGWELSAGHNLGAIDFGSTTAEWYREHIEAPWFAHWLKNRERPALPEVTSFRTGSNQWQQYDAWPPKTGIREGKLFLQSNSELSFAAAPSSPQSDSYVSNPAKPVPFMPRPITDNGWPEWQMYDQRFVDGRPDVLTYQTQPLQEDLTITGEPIVHLFAATTGSDADWIVKLIDVYPDVAQPERLGGFEFMLAEEVFRSRYRNSFEKPEPVVPGEITPYVFSLRSRDHTFKAGHRIMVQIQSTWFPLIDRNPQTYVPNIYDAVQTDFHTQTHSIYRGGAAASYISLPLNEK